MLLHLLLPIWAAPTTFANAQHLYALFWRSPFEKTEVPSEFAAVHAELCKLTPVYFSDGGDTRARMLKITSELRNSDSVCAFHLSDASLRVRSCKRYQHVIKHEENTNRMAHSRFRTHRSPFDSSRRSRS